MDVVLKHRPGQQTADSYIVSILVLMDVVLKLKIITMERQESKVSILVLMDVVLKPNAPFGNVIKEKKFQSLF